MNPRFGIALLVLLAPTGAAAAEWRMQPATSKLAFEGNSQGSTFQGRFGKFSPRIVFDAANPAAASFDVWIDLASARTSNSERDEALPGKDFFWVEKHPRARFTAKACRSAAPAGRFECAGTLSLRGKSVPVRFPFAWSGDDLRAKLTSKLVLDRLDFDIGAGEWSDPATLAHEVTVRIALDLRATPPTLPSPAPR